MGFQRLGEGLTRTTKVMQIQQVAGRQEAIQALPPPGLNARTSLAAYLSRPSSAVFSFAGASTQFLFLLATAPHFRTCVGTDVLCVDSGELSLLCAFKPFFFRVHPHRSSLAYARSPISYRDSLVSALAVRLRSPNILVDLSVILLGLLFSACDESAPRVHRLLLLCPGTWCLRSFSPPQWLHSLSPACHALPGLALHATCAD